jgi:hypothetical protein
MGYMNAYDAAAMADAGELMDYDQALELHLVSNHYPPVPVSFVPACKQAIKTMVIAAQSAETLGEEQVFNQLSQTMVQIPNGENMSVLEIVDALHLEAFIDFELGKYGI